MFVTFEGFLWYNCCYNVWLLKSKPFSKMSPTSVLQANLKSQWNVLWWYVVCNSLIAVTPPLSSYRLLLILWNVSSLKLNMLYIPELHLVLLKSGCSLSRIKSGANLNLIKQVDDIWISGALFWINLSL